MSGVDLYAGSEAHVGVCDCVGACELREAAVDDDATDVVHEADAPVHEYAISLRDDDSFFVRALGDAPIVDGSAGLIAVSWTTADGAHGVLGKLASFDFSTNLATPDSLRITLSSSTSAQAFKIVPQVVVLHVCGTPVTDVFADIMRVSASLAGRRKRGRGE